MDLFENETKHTLSREDAAKRLREIADVLARNNQIELEKDGRRITVAVPDEVELSVESPAAKGPAEDHSMHGG